jgi:Tol biopolymer transport system component
MNSKQVVHTGKGMRRFNAVTFAILLLTFSLGGCSGRIQTVSVIPTPAGTGTSSSPLATPLPETIPDGRFVFHSNIAGSYNIYSMEVSGSKGDLHQLTSSTGRNIEPVWSPDGRLIAFASDRDDPTGLNIYVMNADGSDQHPLTNHTGYALSPSWSPDGKKLVFHTNWEGRLQLYTIEIDGGEPQKLLDIAGNAYVPDWSPDGSRIAFIGDQHGGNDDIYFTDLASGEITRVTTSFERDLWPSWSPDGMKLAFQHHEGVKRNIVVYDLKAGTLVTVLDDDYRDAMPAWAGDKYIVCSSSIDQSPWALYILDFNGNRYSLVKERRDCRHPHWTEQ